MNSKELEHNIKFTGGLVYCGQTTGVSSVGTRIQKPGVQSSPAGGSSWLHHTHHRVFLSILWNLRNMRHCAPNPTPHFSSTGFYLTTHLKEKIIQPLNITLLRKQGFFFLPLLIKEGNFLIWFGLI